MSSKPRVLVVDDSLTVRMDLRAALSTAGFAVSACSTKEEALRTLRSQAFDLAILDVALPDGNGIDLLKEIKLTPELRTLRVFMLSTEGEVRSRIRGLLQGADLYVGKPYDRGYVANKARALFKLSDRSGPPASRRALSNKNILIVDDCPKFAKALAAELRQRGNQVTLADTGEDALALLSIERFDCVFLDLIMPRAHREMGLKEQAEKLATVQESFTQRQGIKLYGEVHRDGKLVGSEAICHNKVIEEIALPGQVVAGTDSHTCMAGALGCFAFGVGSTDMANAWLTKDVRVAVPESASALRCCSIALRTGASSALVRPVPSASGATPPPWSAARSAKPPQPHPISRMAEGPFSSSASRTKSVCIDVLTRQPTM